MNWRWFSNKGDTIRKRETSGDTQSGRQNTPVGNSHRFEAGKRWVRDKSLKGFKDKIREKTKRSRGDSLTCIIADLTRRSEVGMAISNTPTEGYSPFWMDSSVDDYGRYCVTGKNGRDGESATPIIFAGQMYTSQNWGYSP